jgi:hypothetical protein
MAKLLLVWLITGTASMNAQHVLLPDSFKRFIKTLNQMLGKWMF